MKFQMHVQNFVKIEKKTIFIEICESNEISKQNHKLLSEQKCILHMSALF